MITKKVFWLEQGGLVISLLLLGVLTLTGVTIWFLLAPTQVRSPEVKIESSPLPTPTPNVPEFILQPIDYLWVDLPYDKENTRIWVKIDKEGLVQRIIFNPQEHKILGAYTNPIINKELEDLFQVWENKIEKLNKEPKEASDSAKAVVALQSGEQYWRLELLTEQVPDEMIKQILSIGQGAWVWREDKIFFQAQKIGLSQPGVDDGIISDIFQLKQALEAPGEFVGGGSGHLLFEKIPPKTTSFIVSYQGNSYEVEIYRP